MKPCEAIRADLAAYVYGDLAAAEVRDLDEHLEACAGCREELRGLQRASLRLGDGLLFPRESEVDWQAFTRATVQRARGFKAAPGAAEKRVPRLIDVSAIWRPIRIVPAWAAAAASFLILFGTALGTWGLLSRGPDEERANVIAEAAEEPSARIPDAMLADIEESSARNGTQRYLAESRALLVSLLATPIRCENDEIDIRQERQKSIELLRRQRLIADSLEQLPLARAQDVCRDLEELLLEVASLSDCARGDQIGEIRRLVESRRLLLRLELVSDEMKRSVTRDV